MILVLFLTSFSYSSNFVPKNDLMEPFKGNHLKRLKNVNRFLPVFKVRAFVRPGTPKLNKNKSSSELIDEILEMLEIYTEYNKDF